MGLKLDHYNGIDLSFDCPYCSITLHASVTKPDRSRGLDVLCSHCMKTTRIPASLLTIRRGQAHFGRGLLLLAQGFPGRLPASLIRARREASQTVVAGLVSELQLPIRGHRLSAPRTVGCFAPQEDQTRQIMLTKSRQIILKVTAADGDRRDPQIH